MSTTQQSRGFSRRNFLGAAAIAPVAASTLPVGATGANLTTLIQALPLPASTVSLLKSGQAIQTIIASGFDPNKVIGFLLEGYAPTEVAESLSDRIDSYEKLKDNPDTYIASHGGNAIQKLRYALCNRTEENYGNQTLAEFLDPNRHLAQRISNSACSDEPDALKKILNLSEDTGYFSKARMMSDILPPHLTVNQALAAMETREIEILTPYIRAEYLSDPHKFMQNLAEDFKYWDKESFMPAIKKILGAIPSPGASHPSATDLFSEQFDKAWNIAKESIGKLPKFNAYLIPELSSVGYKCFALLPQSTYSHVDYKNKLASALGTEHVEWQSTNTVRLKNGTTAQKTLLMMAENSPELYQPSHHVTHANHHNTIEREAISGSLGFGM